MEITILEKDLKGFNEKAKEKLIEASKEFISDLIEESNRIESARNSTSNDPEVTSSMVNDAKVLIRRGIYKPKINIGVKLLRVAAAVFPLLVGILYDSTRLQNSGYMLLFIIVITTAILIVTISIIKE